MITEKAYAKINIALEVMEECDGYHEVNNIMVPISLYDEITLEEAPNIYVENDFIENNLCVRAANLFLKHFHISKGVKITLKKNIPMAAGLAGGSSDAAAVLRGLNKLYDVKAKDEELVKLAGELGSDIGFFIYGKPAICTHRGEIVHPLEASCKFSLVLVKPRIGLSTREVYKRYIYKGISKKEQIEKIQFALKNQDISLLKENIFNDLEEAAFSLSKELQEYQSIFYENNLFPFLSGSGPTLYFIEPTSREIEKIKELSPKDAFICLCETI